ncbi:hypothetical protein A3B59_04875 [Candidatus Beckwithbacteria bacterium RIFCSPLOWO2_01_FULL_49_47]|nr:MAG: hypothetical protein UY43_C0001G0806 [Candidatus Beckwithbacteria bacterium GW2011_GWC1_49_16]OGD59248.1 MAG: hypothetical protein A3J22_02240 [Candidatus Beckwithbacteria bacterium RIFCSPLOWO2_02_FULL_49_12]OGD59768.1 MAG: hypothetical protein A3B59_04875 [Candidatus Beckwithbacteria bacterium RIFCSPLOWO2_01_FULL_49_47]
MKLKLIILGLVLAGAFTAGAIKSNTNRSAYACGGDCNGDHEDEVTICQCRVREDVLQCRTIEVDEEDVEDIFEAYPRSYLGACTSPSPSPSPSPEPSEEPSPSPSPSPTPETEVGLGVNGPSCTSNSFSANISVLVGGVGQEGVEVKFNYQDQEKSATTNDKGEASVDFEFKGNGEVKATSAGYPEQKAGVEAVREDCPSTGGTGEVLGAATGGQVLGAMADTGDPVTDLMLVLFTMGSTLAGTGLRLYSKKS